MKSIRWRFVLLVLWLTLLYNIERPNFDLRGTVNLASSFYILVAATVALLLYVPLSRRQLYLATAGVLLIYTVLKMVEPTPLFVDVHKYLTITEIVALLITVGLTWSASQATQDFEGAVEAISLPEGRARFASHEQVQEHLKAEIGRARRHQRPLSVAKIVLAPATFEAALHRAVREAQAAMIERYVNVRFGMFLSRHIRDTDMVAHQPEEGGFLLVAPETAASQTAEMLHRLARKVEVETGLRFRYSIADFPDAALTSEELLRRVREDLPHAPGPFDTHPSNADQQPADELEEASARTLLPEGGD